MGTIFLPVFLTAVLLVLQLGSCSPCRGDKYPNSRGGGRLADDAAAVKSVTSTNGENFLKSYRPELSIKLAERNERKSLLDGVQRIKRQISDLPNKTTNEETFTISPDESLTESIETTSSNAPPSTTVDSYDPPPSGTPSNGYGPPSLLSPSTSQWATAYPPSYTTPALSFGPSSSKPGFGYGNSETKDVDKIYITNSGHPSNTSEFHGYPGYFYHIIGPFYSHRQNPHHSKFRPSYPDPWRNLWEIRRSSFMPPYLETGFDHHLWNRHNYLIRDF